MLTLMDIIAFYFFQFPVMGAGSRVVELCDSGNALAQGAAPKAPAKFYFEFDN